ncbi:MAG: radical SAM protein [Nitrospirae bacterium]|nr:radical SAM protein [Nitrospirota bacterium]
MDYSYLSSDYKIRFHIERVKHLLEYGYSYPSHFTIGLVTYCDQCCKSCYAGAYRYNKDIMVTMSLDIIKKILHEASMFGSQYHNHEYYSKDTLGLKAVTFVGSGEPLLYPYITELLHYVNENLNLDIGIYTNGNNLRDNWHRYGIDDDDVKADIQTAILNNCRFVRISLDAATPQTHFKTRGVENQFDSIIKNIRQMVMKRKGQFPTLGIQFTVDHNNYKEIIQIAMLAKDIGVDYLSFKPKYLPWNNKGNFYDLITFEQISDDLEKAISYSDNHTTIHGKVDQFMVAWGKTRYQTSSSSYKCHSVWLSSYLDIDVNSRDKNSAEPKIFLCVNKNKEDMHSNGSLRWSSSSINIDTNLKYFWEKEMEILCNRININDCISGCRNQPYNNAINKIASLGIDKIDESKEDFKNAPKDIHPGHI